jgi:hypothetical protein
MTQFSGSNSANFTGTHQEGGTAGGVIAWGRWTGLVTGLDGGTFSINPTANQGYSYVVGLPTSVMPTGVANVPFTLMGATTPTGSDGTLTGGTFSGTMSVNFAAGTAALTAAIGFTGPTPATYNMTGSATFSSAAFTGTMTGGPSGAVPPGYCTIGCTANVDGAFFGAGAAYAGYAYRITSTSSIAGVAVFKQ